MVPRPMKPIVLPILTPLLPIPGPCPELSADFRDQRIRPQRGGRFSIAGHPTSRSDRGPVRGRPRESLGRWPTVKVAHLTVLTSTFVPLAFRGSSAQFAKRTPTLGPSPSGE